MKKTLHAAPAFTYLNQFPDFAPLEFDIQSLGLPLRDESWRQDAHPRWSYETDEHVLWVGVDYADAALRETGEDGKRFCIYTTTLEGEQNSVTKETDDLDELRAWVTRYAEHGYLPA